MGAEAANPQQQLVGLDELGDALPGQSRSTVQHRLRRLVELELLEEYQVGLQGVAYVARYPLGHRHQ